MPFDISPETVRRLVAGAVAIVVLSAFALFYLGGQTSRILSTVGAPLTGDAVGSGAGSGSGAGAGSGVGGSTGSGSAAQANAAAPTIVDAVRPDLLVIRTGRLELHVADVDRAVEAATRRIDALGGYVSGAEQGGDGEGATASVTFRIPVDAWDDALIDLRSLGERVVGMKTQTEEVTAQVVDLDARIANLEVTERALQAILAKATVIKDVLEVQGQLTTVRGQIEEAQARRQHILDQAAYSTLTVWFGLKPVPAVVATQAGFDPGHEVDRATARLVGILQQGLTAMIWFGIVWLPFVALFGLAAAAAAFYVRSRRPIARPPAGGTF